MVWSTLPGVRRVPAELAAKLVTAFDRVGGSFDDVRMDDLAKASGIPRATLYYYFSGKDEVLGFLLDASLDELAARLATPAGDDARSRLRDILHRQLEHFAGRPAMAQLVTLNLGKAGKLSDLTVAADRGFVGPVRHVLEAGIRAGEIRDDIDLAAVPSAISGAVYTLAMRTLVRDASIDPAALADTLIDLFWGGLRPDPPPDETTRS
jgi:AcrR family transcriptional regulator